jgi:hypothetical protein
MRQDLVKLLRLTGFVVALALMLAGQAIAGNDQTFTDAGGDNQGAGTDAFAVDITSVQAVSTDDGLLTFTVTIQTPPEFGGKLFTGDFVNVWVDGDHDTTTGENGYEVRLTAKGVTDAQPIGEFCRVDADSTVLSCEPAGITAVISGPQTQVLTFSFYTGNWFVIQFLTESRFEPNVDLAPDSGFFEFDLRTDPDGDGIITQFDRCPNKPAGNFDTDDDGCPGPLARLPDISIRYDGLSKGFASVSFRVFEIREAPAGTKVKVRAGNRTYQRNGSGPIRGLQNRLLPAGQRITITVSGPGYCSRVRVIRINPNSANGFTNVSERNVRPGGGVTCA